MISMFPVWEGHRRSQITAGLQLNKNVNKRQKLLDPDSTTELQNEHWGGLPPLGEAHVDSNDVLKKRLD